MIRISPDQAMLVFEHAAADAAQVVSDAMKGTVYTTLQTDAWVVLTLAGGNARAALERLCPLDLHDSVFAVNSAARTVMEHMGAMILRESDVSGQVGTALVPGGTCSRHRLRASESASGLSVF